MQTNDVDTPDARHTITVERHGREWWVAVTDADGNEEEVGFAGSLADLLREAGAIIRP